MELDQFLSQPPEAVRDDGFSAAVKLGLYEKHRRRFNLLLAACLLLLLPLLVLAAPPLLTQIPQQLTAWAWSPVILYLGAAVAMLLLALQPRLLRF
jgi:hypothetical protein